MGEGGRGDMNSLPAVEAGRQHCQAHCPHTGGRQTPKQGDLTFAHREQPRAAEGAPPGAPLQFSVRP